MSDEDFIKARENDEHLRTKEAVWYKRIYDELFPRELPKDGFQELIGKELDMTHGRAQQVHENTTLN